MIDVGGKAVTRRRAVARGRVRLGRAAFDALVSGRLSKGDALAVARAALREPDLPTAGHDQASWEVKLLVDHREHLVAERTRTINRLRWHLHQLDPDLEHAARRLPGPSLDRVTAWLAGAPVVGSGRHLPGVDRHDHSADGAHRPAHRAAAPAGRPTGTQPAQPARLRGADRGQAHR